MNDEVKRDCLHFIVHRSYFIVNVSSFAREYDLGLLFGRCGELLHALAPVGGGHGF
jgi:hypothetical protein